MERVLVWNDADELVCHVGVHTRVAKWDGQTIKIGGVGGVITRQDARGRGYASAAMRAAISEMREKGGSDFALLVCEVHNFAFYRVSVGVNSRATCSWNSPKAASGSTS
jgi:predicted GNAT family N-acyltransferase